MQTVPLRVLRVAVSAVLTCSLVVTCTLIPIVNAMTVTLLMILEIVFLAVWGRVEAFLAAIVAAIGSDYFYLPPKGFGMDGADQMVAFACFLMAATAITQVTSRMKQHQLEINTRRKEIEMLHKLGAAIVDSEDLASTLQRLPEYIVEIFGARQAAVYDQPSGLISRAGSGSNLLSDDRLRSVALGGQNWIDKAAAVFVAPIGPNGSGAGSVGVAGSVCALPLADQIAERVGVGVAKVYAAEKEMAAEVMHRTDELKSAILDALVHEIKSPIAAMNVAVTTLLSQHKGNEAQQQELLGAIKREMNRLNRRIDEVVRTAQIWPASVGQKAAPYSRDRNRVALRDGASFTRSGC